MVENEQTSRERQKQDLKERVEMVCNLMTGVIENPGKRQSRFTTSRRDSSMSEDATPVGGDAHDIPDPGGLPHKDELPPFNGDTKADWARDDEGNVFKVVCGDSFPKTGFIPKERTPEYFLPRREGVGQDCATCGGRIGEHAIILSDPEGERHHLRCYEE